MLQRSWRSAHGPAAPTAANRPILQQNPMQGGRRLEQSAPVATATPIWRWAQEFAQHRTPTATAPQPTVAAGVPCCRCLMVRAVSAQAVGVER
mmetsp:Transcript_4381/g.10597  ORF Transcript_4381/g.10597 Transcript_4381/m.10597 type:complete len:93 (-) Transcript_4381:178-456(-)